MDEFFQTERDHNIIVTGCTKNAAEVSPSSMFEQFVFLPHTTRYTLFCLNFLNLFFLAEVPGCGAN